MERYSDSVIDPTGAAVAGALITVVNQDGTTPVLLDDDGATLDNPLTSDEYGAFYFNLDDAGYVDLKFYYGGRLVQEQLGVVVGAPPPVTGAGGSDGQAQFNDGGVLGGFTGLTLDDGALSQVTVDAGTAIAGGSPPMVIEQAFNAADTFSGIEHRISFTSNKTSSAARSWQSFVDGQEFYSVSYYGPDDYPYLRLTKPDVPTSHGGIRVVGSAGEMALQSLGEDAFRWFWDNSAHVGSGDPASASVLVGMGGNRFALEGPTFSFQALYNARFEWEGLGAARLAFVGFEAASAIGKTFDFNNYGQTPTRASPVVSISIDPAHTGDDTLHLGTFDGTNYVVKAKFDGSGRLTVPAVIDGGTITRAPGTSLTGTTAETTLATITLPANSMGPNGQIEIETYFSCPANVNAKTLRVKFGGTTIFTSPAIGSTNTGHQAHIRVSNKTAGTQVTFPTIGPGHGASTAAPVTSSVDTTANVTILITGQLGDVGDTMILESYYVVTHYGA